MDYSRMAGIDNIVSIGLRKVILYFDRLAAAQGASAKFMFMLPCKKIVVVTAALKYKKLF